MKHTSRLDQFPEYIFSQLNRKVKEVEQRTGRKVLNLGIGSPDIPPSPIYLEKLKEYISEPTAHLYPGYGATADFSAALINWYQKRFGVAIEDNELLPLLGAKDGVSHIVLALLDAGDEVLIPDSGYPGFSGPALMVGARPVYYNLTHSNNFKIDLKELQEKVTVRTKCLWVNFPANPTGQVVEVGELEPIVKFAKDHDIVLLYDNAYSEITFDEYVAPSILQVNGAKDVAVEFGSFSKTFSLAGYRMGWVVGNHKVIAALAKIKSQIDSGMSLPLQKLGAFALTKTDKVWHDQMIETYKRRRDTIANNLRKIGLDFIIPRGSLYLWAKIPRHFKNSEEFSLQLLWEKQILLTPGTAFGQNGKNYVRASICVNVDHISDYFI